MTQQLFCLDLQFIEGPGLGSTYAKHPYLFTSKRAALMMGAVLHKRDRWGATYGHVTNAATGEYVDPNDHNNSAHRHAWHKHQLAQRGF